MGAQIGFEKIARLQYWQKKIYELQGPKVSWLILGEDNIYIWALKYAKNILAETKLPAPTQSLNGHSLSKVLYQVYKPLVITIEHQL